MKSNLSKHIQELKQIVAELRQLQKADAADIPTQQFPLKDEMKPLPKFPQTPPKPKNPDAPKISIAEPKPVALKLPEIPPVNSYAPSPKSAMQEGNDTNAELIALIKELLAAFKKP